MKIQFEWGGGKDVPLERVAKENSGVKQLTYREAQVIEGEFTVEVPDGGSSQDK